MTLDDIIRMAREADEYASRLHVVDPPYDWQGLRDEHFAALVAAAKEAELMDRMTIAYMDGHEKGKDAGAAAEREKVAKMIEDAPKLVKFATNDKGGCLVCGFTPKLAAAELRRLHEANQELLEALKDAEELIGREPFEHTAQEEADAHKNIRAVIAKAEGRA